MVDMHPLTTHLIELFRGPLRDVRFPDADADRLAAAASAVADARVGVAQAEAALAAARAQLSDKERAVLHETERTLAYARIYAANRPELAAAIDSVPASPPRRGPGRPRKARVVKDGAPASAVDEAAE